MKDKTQIATVHFECDVDDEGKILDSRTTVTYRDENWKDRAKNGLNNFVEELARRLTIE